MRDISGFQSNFVKTKGKFLQKVPNRRHRQYATLLYGFERFVNKEYYSCETANTDLSRKIVSKISPV